jgi:hypothetical protein
MRYRHDGFTAKKQRRFLVQVAKSGCIADGCRAAKVSKTTIERWRAKDPPFAGRLAAALDRAAAVIDVLAWQRGVTGIEEPVYAYGKIVGVRIKRSDAVFRMLMIASDPEKYGRMGAAGRGKAREAAPPTPRMTRKRAREISAEVEQLLSDFNRRMGGDG